MPNKKIIQLPTSTTPLTGAEIVPVVQSGATVQTSVNSLGPGVGYTPAGTGAVATTVQTKLRESVSVKDFGAVGNGTTDNTAAFNTIEALSNTYFYMPEGLYKTTQLNLTKVYWGPGRIQFNDGYIQQGVDFTIYPARNVTGNFTIGAPGDLVLNPNGNVTFAGKRIQNIGNPLGNLDAVNLSYFNSNAASQTQVTALNSSVATLQTDVTALNSSVATLQTNVTALNSSVTTLQTSVTALNSSVTTLQTNVGNFQYSFGSFTPTITTDLGGTGTYTIQTGSWVKTGKLVTIRAYVAFTNYTVTSGLGHISILTTGAPTPVANSGVYNQIGQVYSTFPTGTDYPNNFLFSAFQSDGSIDFYRKPTANSTTNSYTTFLNLIAAVSGTAQTGTTTSVTLAVSASSSDGYYVDRTIVVTTGGVPETKTILSYNGTTKVVGISAASPFTTAPTSSSTYTINPSGVLQTIISYETT